MRSGSRNVWNSGVSHSGSVSPLAADVRTSLRKAVVFGSGSAIGFGAVVLQRRDVDLGDAVGQRAGRRRRAWLTSAMTVTLSSGKRATKVEKPVMPPPCACRGRVAVRIDLPARAHSVDALPSLKRIGVHIAS